METISNEWPGSREVAPYEPPELSAEIGVDFLESTDLSDLEGGIRKIERATDLLALIQGLGIVKIEREGLWQQAGFRSLRDYQKDQAKRLNMPGPTISSRRRIGEAWIQYRKDLAEFPLQGHVAKLRFFGQAMKLHQKKTLVLKHFREDSFRDFVRFSRPERPELQEVASSLRAGVLYIDDSPVARVDAGLSEEERAFIETVLRRAYTARRGNLVPHIVPVYDKGEARAVDNFLKKYRSGK